MADLVSTRQIMVDSLVDSDLCAPVKRIYPKAFITLNLRFAQRLHQLTGVSLERAMRTHTNLYLAFGLGPSLNERHPVWRAWIQQSAQHPDPVDLAYQYHLAAKRSAAKVTRFGCFSFAVRGTGVRIHFRADRDPSGHALSALRQTQRVGELKKMFAHIQVNGPGCDHVLGSSWLYHHPAYRRLFPQKYLDSAVEAENEFQFLSLWGQLLDRRWRMHPERAPQFESQMTRATDDYSLKHSFPYSCLKLSAPIEVFYDHLGL